MSKTCLFCKESGHTHEKCEKLLKIMEEGDKERRKWSDAHSSCPVCSNSQICQTLAGHASIEDNINHASCDLCGWKGMVKDLTPKLIIDVTTGVPAN